MPSQQLSVFDMFKVGVGPSSSHTMGPWRAAQRFLRELPPPGPAGVARVAVRLYGSLAKTGRGHGTDIAVQLGLSGLDPETIDVGSIGPRIQEIADARQIVLQGRFAVPFDPQTDLQFHGEPLPFHPNGITFVAELRDGAQSEATYYSVGGGFVVAEQEPPAPEADPFPCPVDTAGQLLAHCRERRCSVSEVVLRNETSRRSDAEVRAGVARLRDAMIASVHRGCRTDGVLPGGLGVRRRACRMAEKLLGEPAGPDSAQWIAAIRRSAGGFPAVIDWVSCFALAVNEENAAFGRVVTAPTNGSAGVIPAVLLYGLLYCDFSDDAAFHFLLTASQVGCLFKKGATISAALGGCQAEIGVSSAMAAAGLAEALGGSPEQAAMAAEIAMEHHLGMTCDPIGGLVQIPCIERNAFGAVKAITAARMALGRDPSDARVSLDAVIRTMWETARDMNDKYKETSEGGLALYIPVNVIEC
ncbi:L-serine dehydratase 1 [Pirellulimonas nuda]|uniref:L-serine dehydratase n=1 Tax=Pirellulimonas nuda TaxID=2528009 RepID=A0A518DCP1_9BACT|nr:L-serine dehydratase 1 [Pirellulimonas nuda]